MNFFQKIRLKLIYISAKKLFCENIGGHYVRVKDIKHNKVIIDLGANKAAFSIAMNRTFNTSSICVEANKQLFEKLPEYNWLEKEYAVCGAKDGSVEFIISYNDEASSIYPEIANVWDTKSKHIVPSISLQTLIKKYNNLKIAYLKIDIEGAEIDVLKYTPNDTLLAIPQIGVEFHEYLSDKFFSDTKEVLTRMHKIGFYSIITSSSKYAEVLFLNKNQIHFSLSDKLWYAFHKVVAYSA